MMTQQQEEEYRRLKTHMRWAIGVVFLCFLSPMTDVFKEPVPFERQVAMFAEGVAYASTVSVIIYCYVITELCVAMTYKGGYLGSMMISATFGVLIINATWVVDWLFGLPFVFLPEEVFDYSVNGAAFGAMIHFALAWTGMLSNTDSVPDETF
jgi:hypothetical protein